MPKNVAGTRGPNGRKADVLPVAPRRRDKSKPAHGLFEGERTMRRAARERTAGQGGTPGRIRSASSIEHPAATGGERTFGSRAAMESCACRMRPRRVASAPWLSAQCTVGRKAAPWRGDGRPRPRAPPPPIARPSTPPYPRPPPLGHRWRQCSDANRTWKAPGQVAGPSSTKGYSASGPKPRAQTDLDCRRAPSVRQGETQLAELRFVSVRHECEEGEHAAGWERNCKRSLGGSGVAD